MYKAVTLAGGIREPLLTCSSFTVLWLFIPAIEPALLKVTVHYLMDRYLQFLQSSIIKMNLFGFILPVLNMHMNVQEELLH